MAAELSVQGERLWEARVETLGKISAAVGHEASNILGALGTCLQILRRNPYLPPEDAELLDIIQSGSRRLHEMVSEFALFKSSGPRLELFDLHELIDETIALVEGDGRCGSALVICRQFDSLVHHVHADRDQLRAVFWNLCLNGIEAMEGQGRIGIETQSEGEEIRISVRDNGPGIPSGVSGKLFEPFYSTKERRMGLGLAAVRYLVRKHKGRISIESGPGIGTCFIVHLPAAAYSP